MRDKLELLKQMMQPEFDWETHWDEYEDADIRYFLMECFRKYEGPTGLYACGSAELPDTPKSLYRALWLFGPKNVDFSDMYKTCVFKSVSPCKRFCFHFDLYKYEAGLYFYCHKDVFESKNIGIVGGAPGTDNHWRCTDKVGNLWFEVAKMALEFEYEVYGGNDFSV